MDLREATEAAKYQNFVHPACNIANETFIKATYESTELELKNTDLIEHYNAMVAELDGLTEKYVDLSQRHMNLAAEFNKESAECQQLAAQVAQLEEELRQTRLGTKHIRQHQATKTPGVPPPIAKSFGDRRSHQDRMGHGNSPQRQTFSATCLNRRTAIPLMHAFKHHLTMKTQTCNPRLRQVSSKYKPRFSTLGENTMALPIYRLIASSPKPNRQTNPATSQQANRIPHKHQP